MSSVISTQRPMHPVAQELAASSGFLLSRLGFGFKSEGIARAEEAGFEVYDYGVLAMLAEGVRQTQATIADALGVDPSRLVALLDSLEERGLITRQRDPQDRRRHVVSITDAGTRALGQLRELIVEFENEFFAPLDGQARAQLHELLTRLAMQNDPRCCPLIELEESPMPASI
ncbi:MAG: MarR family winged helix-turn-helix transcriptional regulator [Solirubrobacteraceae bacterium]